MKTNLRSKAIQIRTMGIIGICIYALDIALSIFLISMSTSFINGGVSENTFGNSYGIVSIILLVFSVILFALNITCCIKILTTNWRNEKLNNQKTIWGIFSIVLLGPISSVIFGSMASKTLKNHQDNNYELNVSTENNVSEENDYYIEGD